MKIRQFVGLVLPRNIERSGLIGLSGHLKTRRRFLTQSIFPQGEPNDENDTDNDKGSDKSARGSNYRDTAFKAFESAAVTLASISVLFISGYLYHQYYKAKVLKKIQIAFEAGDPALDLAMRSKTGNGEADWVVREEQDLIDRVVAGKVPNRYFLLIGEKGTGKTSMLLEAMRRVAGHNCAMFEAHADPEIVRIRLGKALNYDYHEDYIGSLFSIRGPRDTTALLDIERAFDKLEKVALEKVRATKIPLVVIVNSTHLLREDKDGEDLMELLQQRAESFAASGLVTFIFNSDEYWVYERFKKLSTRLEVVTIKDLDRSRSVEAIRSWRKKYFNEEVPEAVGDEIYNIIGGRPQFLNRVAAHQNMVSHALSIVEKEKTWLLNKCGLLGSDMDDDVMESGKFSGSAMLLMKALVDMDKAYRTKNIVAATDNHYLPSLPLWRARQVMTRPDYIQRYDHLNIFTIDSHSMVRADSVAMMHAFRQIINEDGFDDLLEETLDRVSEIESLGRTRELVAKDLVGGVGAYEVTIGPNKTAIVKVVNPEQ
ncbi:hypothetical protein V1514DRAFT_278423 [Lipomyces japonicus]|uniref:uncharacterized protein n=1 Tax=Lipomyces japonicus TaxID=56871 RepID=UPI0034CE8625